MRSFQTLRDVLAEEEEPWQKPLYKCREHIMYPKVHTRESLTKPCRPHAELHAGRCWVRMSWDDETTGCGLHEGLLLGPEPGLMS